MPVVINSNVTSINASRILASNRAGLEKAMERLASGKRINSSSDDAAGMAVAAKLRSTTKSLDQAVRNTNDAISMLNTYDGAASEIESMLVRMRELSVQMSNDSYVDADRDLAQEEFSALQDEIDRISSTASFNGAQIGNAKGGPNTDGKFNFLIGALTDGSGSGSDDYAEFSLNSLTTTDLKVASGDAKISTAADAVKAIDTIDGGLASLATARAVVGASVNRLSHTVSNLMNVSQRQKEALSGVEDADYAAESAALARGMVLAQAGSAMLAQANQQPQYVLTLLR